MNQAANLSSKRLGKSWGFAVKPVNQSPSTTGSVVENSLNSVFEEGEVLLKAER